MTEMRALKTDLLLWKPEVDQRVHELEHVVLDLGECIDHALGSLVPQAQPLERSDEEPSGGVTIAQPPLTAAIREDHFDSSSVKMPSSAHLELHPPRAASGSLDHDKGSTHRGADFGAVYTIAREPAPVTGATLSPKPAPTLFQSDSSGHRDRRYYRYPPYTPLTPFPEVEFHKFDGSNPRLWVKRCDLL